HVNGVAFLLREGADPTLVVKGAAPADVARQAGHAEIAATIDAAAAAWKPAAEAPDAYLAAPRFSAIASLDGYATAVLRNEIFARHGQPFQRKTFAKA